MSLNFSIDDLNVYDTIIIGGGPAALTAAIYLKRANLEVAFIEKDAPGGKMVKTNLIENYSGFKSIGGPNLALEMFKQATDLGAKYIFGNVLKVEKNNRNFIIETDNNRYSAKTIIIASGMTEKKLGLADEDKYYGKGVSYCATCDGFLYKGKDVAVIGGGNTALDEALYLSDIVNKVYLVHRRLEYRGDLISVAKVKSKPNIEQCLPYVPIKLIANGSVSGLEIQNVADRSKKILNVACVFPFIGLKPVLDFLVNFTSIFDLNAFISVDENFMTPVEGLFAAGDIINKKNRQIATAVGDGSNVAIAVKEYLTFKY